MSSELKIPCQFSWLYNVTQHFLCDLDLVTFFFFRFDRCFAAFKDQQKLDKASRDKGKMQVGANPRKVDPNQLNKYMQTKFPTSLRTTQLYTPHHLDPKIQERKKKGLPLNS